MIVLKSVPNIKDGEFDLKNILARTPSDYVSLGGNERSTNRAVILKISTLTCLIIMKVLINM